MFSGIYTYMDSNLDSRRKFNSNTWGFSRKIGDHTFGDYYYHKDGSIITSYEECSGYVINHSTVWRDDGDREKIRNKIRSLTKIFDIAGYIPVISIVSGIIRIIAASILAKYVKEIFNDAGRDFAWEAHRTYKAQIIRGVLEIIPIIGKAINLRLDYYWYDEWGTSSVGNLTEEDFKF